MIVAGWLSSSPNVMQLATGAHETAVVQTLPFPDVVGDVVLLFVRGALVLDIVWGCEQLYSSCLSRQTLALGAGVAAVPGWPAVMHHPQVSNFGICWAYTHRAWRAAQTVWPELQRCPQCQLPLPGPLLGVAHLILVYLVGV